MKTDSEEESRSGVEQRKVIPDRDGRSGAEKIRIISENSYRRSMQEEVVPFLGKYRVIGSFDPQGKGKIYYEKYLGAQARGVIVMIHGFTETAEKYLEMIYYFLCAGYVVYIMDVRGHGHSIREVEDLSMVYIDRFESYLEDLAYLAGIASEENPHVPLFLYGHSMGGGISAALLEKYPDLFQKAVLSSPMIRPLTGGVPFHLAHAIAAVQTLTRRGKSYVIGQHEFRGDETFEDSAAVSEARFDYYYTKKQDNPLLQLSGASYSWLREAARLSNYILKRKHCRKVQAKVLLLAAQKDDFVDADSQTLFVRRVQKAGTEIAMVEMPDTKHEIFMSHDGTMRTYLDRILSFYS